MSWIIKNYWLNSYPILINVADGELRHGGEAISPATDDR